MLVFTTIFMALFIIELVYIKFARLNTIVDSCQELDSKNKNIVRGAGIIIIPAILFFVGFFYKQINPVLASFIIGVLMVAIVSFIDDLKPLPVVTRLIFHVLAITLIFWGFDFFNSFSFTSILVLFGTYILALGYVNIYNFMDGINGMSFLNTLCSYVTFYIINTHLIQFTNDNLIIIFILATLVFGYFNFRNKPKCFLGDVGSITFGFTILYFTLKLFIVTENSLVFIFLGVYSLDGGWTILERLFKKENIFKAHLKHLYELLVYKLKISHLKIALLYFGFQVVLNGLVYQAIKTEYNSTVCFIILLGLLSLLYFAIKQSVYKRIKRYNETN